MNFPFAFSTIVVDFKRHLKNITKSYDGNPGEKNARSNSMDTYGNVSENTSYGVFGTYTHDIDTSKLYKVALPSNIHVGDAKILTVISGDKPMEYDIKILMNENSASASEVFALAMNRVMNYDLIGAKSFGKGVYQRDFK